MIRSDTNELNPHLAISHDQDKPITIYNFRYEFWTQGKMQLISYVIKYHYTNETPHNLSV